MTPPFLFSFASQRQWPSLRAGRERGSLSHFGGEILFGVWGIFEGGL
jgi:hypothetical protein